MRTPAQKMKLTQGFTLIETLVVIAVVGILLIPGIAAYNRMNERAQVQRTANSIMSALLAVQKDADSGVGANRCEVNSPYNGIRLEYVAATETYNKWVQCAGEGNGNNSQINTQAIELPIPNGVVIENFGNITFRVLSQSIAAVPVIVVRNASGSVRYEITVERAGGISVNEPE